MKFMGYEFKVGDAGKTRGGDDYVVLDVDERAGDYPVFWKCISDGEAHPKTATKDGQYYSWGTEGDMDLMPPAGEVETLYVTLDNDGDFDVCCNLEYLGAYGVKAFAKVELAEGDGMDEWRALKGDAGEEKRGNGELWPGRVVYSEELIENIVGDETTCWTDQIGMIEQVLRIGKYGSNCGFAWLNTPQGFDWWSDRQGELTKETRAAIEDLLAQVYHAKDPDKYDARAMRLDECTVDCVEAMTPSGFAWRHTPEGGDYWVRRERNGHDHESRVKVKQIILAGRDAGLI
jgi:hypothetical protein